MGSCVTVWESLGLGVQWRVRVFRVAGKGVNMGEEGGGGAGGGGVRGARKD